jgi:hypothetical protein
VGGASSAPDGRAESRARIKAAAAVKNNDSPDVLAMVAVRDGEAWNDRRLPEVGRALTQALAEIDALAARVDGLLAELDQAKRALARAVYLGEHLLGMVPREVWREQGGDDQQGHYEGDYWAEQTAAELKSLAALSPEQKEPGADAQTASAGGETP